MKINHPIAMKLGGLAIATWSRHWMSTLDYAWACYDPRVDPARGDFPRPAIFVFWHEYIAFLFCLRGHCGISMLLSRHRDAQWLSEAARHMGFGTVRGSTFKGGGTALKEMMEQSRETNLAITPDGPRGPRRVLAQGPVYLSSKLQIPIVAFGLGYDRPWRLNTWDRFAIPRPFSRARAVSSPFIQIPPDLDRDGIEHYRLRVQDILNDCTSRAETWAESGLRYEGQLSGRRECSPPRTLRHPLPILLPGACDEVVPFRKAA